MEPQSVTVGEAATVTFNASGGVPVTGVGGLFQGYLAYFFYGQTNASGGIGYSKELAPVPAGCGTSGAACSDPALLSFSHVYTTPGSYDTSFTVYDAAGDYAIGTDEVNVLPPSVTAVPTANVSRATVDGPVRFSATVTTVPTSYETDAFAYQWNFGDNSSGWGNPIVHAYNISGNYAVTVRAFDNRTGTAGQGILSNFSVIDPVPHPVINVTTVPLVAGTYTFPEDAVVNFSAARTTDVPTDLPHLRYLWNFGDGSYATGITSQHQYTDGGSFTVTLTATDPENVAASTEANLSIAYVRPLANATDRGEAFVGQVTTFNAAGTLDVPTDRPLLNYTWSSSDPSATSQPTSYGEIGRNAYFDPGSYDETVLATDGGGLSASASAPISILDSAPNVGLTSAYTLANLTLAVTSDPGADLNLSVLAGGVRIAQGVLTTSHDSSQGSLTLLDVRLPLVDPDVITVTDPGSAGRSGDGVPAELTIAFWGDGNGCTSTYPASLCRAQQFAHTFGGGGAGSRSDGPWTVSASDASVGQAVFLGAQVFSPARTALTTAWDFGDDSYASNSTPAPAAAEPTLANLTVEHRWLPGSSYLLRITTFDAFGRSDTNEVLVGEQGRLAISGVAPTATLQLPVSPTENDTLVLGATLVSENTSQDRFNLVWHFGDGATATQSSARATASEVHFFAYSDTRYAVAAYVSPVGGGPTSVAWGFLTVAPTLPSAVFAGPSGPVYLSSQVLFDGSASQAYSGASALQGLSYAWAFGDGASADAQRATGEVVSHHFTKVGTFPVTLTVTNAEGLSASVTHSVEVIDAPVYGRLVNRTVTVDELATFSVEDLVGLSLDAAGLDAVWSWGDGLPNSTGLTAGHTYLAPGTYRQVVELQSPGGSVAWLTATVHVRDQPLTVILPYDGFTIYGENHTVTFYATVLGSAADEAAGPNAFRYAWSFGDGSPSSVTTAGPVGSVSHTYADAGNPVLTVTAVGPYGSSGSASATLVTVPNWDGDGIPDAFAVAALHLTPGSTPSHGTGLTPFLEADVVGDLNLSLATEQSGLTAFQQVFGSVTGYVSNPMDPDPSGDGIPTGESKFVDSFSADQVVNFTSSGSVTIPGVQHPGDLASVISVELYDEIVSPNLSALDVQLADDGSGGGGTPIDLGAPTGPVSSYTLLSNSPTTGSQSNFSVGLAELTGPSDWVLMVSGGAGTIESASIVISYWLNPNLADPYASGLTVGNTISIPVFNASEPQNVNFTTFNGTTFTYTTVDYYPYDEQYYKLSVVQGIPYYPSQNTSYTYGVGGNVSDSTAWATYYGDRQFGIAPWDTHAAGDPGLTDGMKAYGTWVYNFTANHYLQVNGSWGASEDQRYPEIPSLYYLDPTDPTSNSTGTNGVLDSAAVDPVGGPELIGFYLNNATTGSISIFDLGADANAGGVVQIQDTSFPNSPSMYTESVSGYNNYEFGDTSINWFFDYYDSYQLPLEASDASFTIDLSLWINYDLSSGSEASASLTFQNSPNVRQTFDTGGFTGYAVVYRLERMPVVLVNSSGEVDELPGYGARWVGDQHFYALYLSVGGSTAGTAFQSGENLVLVSRSAFVNSSLNATLATGALGTLPFLDGANLSAPSASSDLNIVGTLNLSLNASDAMALLNATIPHNASGAATGGYQVLATTAFELLGLPATVMSSAPYLPIAGYDSTVGTPAASFWQALGGIIYSAIAEIKSVVVAVISFVATVVAKIGEAIVGLWNAAVHAVESAVQAIASAFDFAIAWVRQELSNLFQELASDAKSWIGEALETIALPILSFLVDCGVISDAAFYSAFASLNATFGIGDPAPENNSTAGQQIATFVEVFTGVIAGIFALVGLLMYTIDIVSLGTATPATEAASLSVTGVIVTVVASVFGVIGGVVGIFGALSAVVPAFNGTDPFSDFINYLNTNVNAHLGSGVITIIANFLVAVTDLIRTAIVAAVSGAYVVGLVLGILALVAAGVAIVFSSSVLAQLVLAAVGFVLGSASVLVQLYPSTDAANDAAQTTLADAAVLVLGLSGAALSITTLTQAADTCAENASACSA